MKQLIQLITIVLSLFCMSHMHAEVCKCHERIYVLPEQLGMSSEGIFVNLNDEWIEVQSVYSDESGIYISPLSIESNGCRNGYTPCRNCGRCVNEQYDICPICHKPV